MRSTALFSTGVLALTLSAGCELGARFRGPHETTKYTVEDTDHFALLGARAQSSITCTGLQERRGAEGRLEVAANLKNREADPRIVEVSCAFKDSAGVMQEATSWRTVKLTAHATETLRFTSSTPNTPGYTIRVRDGK